MSLAFATVVRRGLIAGAAGGFASAAVLLGLGESRISDAIAIEQTANSTNHDEMFSRTVQVVGGVGAIHHKLTLLLGFERIPTICRNSNVAVAVGVDKVLGWCAIKRKCFAVISVVFGAVQQMKRVQIFVRIVANPAHGIAVGYLFFERFLPFVIHNWPVVGIKNGVNQICFPFYFDGLDARSCLFPLPTVLVFGH